MRRESLRRSRATRKCVVILYDDIRLSEMMECSLGKEVFAFVAVTFFLFSSAGVVLTVRTSTIFREGGIRASSKDYKCGVCKFPRRSIFFLGGLCFSALGEQDKYRR